MTQQDELGGRSDIGGFAGLDAEAMEERLAAADLETLCDEVAGRLRERTDPATLEEGFAVRLVVMERRGVLERAFALGPGGWEPRDQGTRADVVVRWQGFAPLLRCENGESRVQAALILRQCEVEGTTEAQEAFTGAIVATSDDPVAKVYFLRGLSDRQLERRLRSFDLEGLVKGMCEIAAEVSQSLGSGREFGRGIITQLEVPSGRQSFVIQVVADGTTTTVHEGMPFEPTITCRFQNPLDFVRICTMEVTPMDLVVGGQIELDGDLSLFANLDLLRF